MSRLTSPLVTYLEKKFGEEYRQYLRQAPRYGWPL